MENSLSKNKTGEIFTKVFFSCPDLKEDHKCGVVSAFRKFGAASTCLNCCIFCSYRPKYRPSLKRGVCSRGFAICPIALRYLRERKGLKDVSKDN